MRYTKDKYIQLIHIAKQQLALDEDTYRTLLTNLTGKTSCKQMKVSELDSVLSEMESKGFRNRAGGFRKNTGKINRTSQGLSPSSADARVKHAIALKIRAVWITMAKQGIIRDGSEQALNQFVRNIINPLLKERRLMVMGVGALDYQMGTIVLERLKQWQKRELTKREVK